MQRKPLGRGLSALIPDPPDTETTEGATLAETVTELPVHQINSNRHQPRIRFQAESIEELAASIRLHGMIQPIVVRPQADGSYELMAGERRLLAARRAGLDRVPALVRQADDGEALEVALVENLLREDLNPIEEARAFSILIEAYGFSQEQVADRVGRDRSTVANTLRLLTLPPEVQEVIAQGALSEGHARAVLMLADPADQKALAGAIQEEGLSVRAAEARARRLRRPRAERPRREPDVFTQAVADEFARALGTKVVIRPRRRGGVVEIHYFSDEELEGIRSRLQRQAMEGDHGTGART
ncbi:MAG: ParB/RepB/Spo0J family partition protein [Candidatus Tectimicrobiota bacterium]